MTTAELSRERCLSAIDRALRATVGYKNTPVIAVRGDRRARLEMIGQLLMSSKADTVTVSADDFALFWKWWE